MLQAQNIYLDAITSLHSNHIRDGQIKSDNTPSLTQSLILDSQKFNSWIDVWVFSEMQKSSYQEAEITLNTGHNIGRHYFSYTLAFYAPEMKNILPELQITADMETKFPLSLTSKYLIKNNSFYNSMSTYLEIDYKLPLVLSTKAGNMSQSDKLFSSDLEIALSTYLSLGNISLEPWLLYTYLCENKNNYLSGNISISWNLINK